jgi:hypothetical protein
MNKDSDVSGGGKLGKGVCILSTEADTKGMAYWRTEVKFCKPLAKNAGVMTQDGKKVNGCQPTNKLVVYSCDGDNMVETPKDCVAEGYVACDATLKACVKCTETDSANNKDIGGIVTVTSLNVSLAPSVKTYNDKCLMGRNSVKQYKCIKNNAVVVAEAACGSNKECIMLDSDGDHCNLKDTVKSVEQRVDTLESLINGVNGQDGLIVKIEKLQCQLTPTVECCLEYSETPGCPVA